VCFGKFLHKASITAIGPGQSDLVEELREADVKSLKPFATGLLCESTGKEGFADSGGTTDKKVLVFSDPVTGEETQDHGFVDSAGSFIIDIFHTSLKFEFGLFEKTLETIVLLPGPLAVDEDTESFFEGEIVEGGLFKLIFKSLGHPEEFHSIEFIEGLFIKHRFDSFHSFGFFDHKKSFVLAFVEMWENLRFFQVLVGSVGKS
jgi:hypothetical protein